MLVSRATHRDGVPDGKVTQCAVGLWCDSFEKEQIPVYTGVPQDQLQRGSLLTLSAIYSLFAATADFSVTFMRTPMTEEVFVERPAEANLPRGKV